MDERWNGSFSRKGYPLRGPTSVATCRARLTCRFYFSIQEEAFAVSTRQRV